MENVILFPFSDYWFFYAGFTAFVLLLLALDLGVFHREAHEVTFKESLTWSIVWISLALIFNYLFFLYAGMKFETDPRLLAIPGFDPDASAKQIGLEFLTGFIVEKTLAVDNIFVFVVVFNFFAIPLKYQHRVLFFGIIGALIFRIIFIAMGSILLQYQWIVIFFGVFLILTGFKIIFAPEKPIDPEKNPVIKLFRKFFPVTPTFEGQKFFLRKEGILYATPLMVALVFIEVSDIIFAVDSVPAIFAITKEPLIVFTSNVFAILGLRALYFMLAGVIHKFRYLKYGLGIVLVFVGLKMAWLNEAFGGKFPISWSLMIITSIITVSIFISLFKKEKEA
ncbi:MAG: TerC/Alx family metal homeostasis membrane protein [Bacteroidetes bacterium]|nr:TerC/Alx family metal homeostasis membrane protein [Bacteroidota bacterium]